MPDLTGYKTYIVAALGVAAAIYQIIQTGSITQEQVDILLMWLGLATGAAKVNRLITKVGE